MPGKVVSESGVGRIRLTCLSSSRPICALTCPKAGLRLAAKFGNLPTPHAAATLREERQPARLQGTNKRARIELGGCRPLKGNYEIEKCKLAQRCLHHHRHLDRRVAPPRQIGRCSPTARAPANPEIHRVPPSLAERQGQIPLIDPKGRRRRPDFIPAGVCGRSGRLRPRGRIAKDARGIHASRHPESKRGEPTTTENWVPTIPAKPRAVSRVGREEQRQRQQFRLRSESLGQKIISRVRHRESHALTLGCPLDDPAPNPLRTPAGLAQNEPHASADVELVFGRDGILQLQADERTADAKLFKVLGWQCHILIWKRLIWLWCRRIVLEKP